MGEVNLFEKAVTNYNVALVLWERVTDDEAFLNQIGYHLQQSLELALKYLLEINGVEYVKTHDIDQLIRLGRENNVEMFLSEYIEDHAEMFSQWEAKSRYVLGYLIEKRKIDKALLEIEKYFHTIENALK